MHGERLIQAAFEAQYFIPEKFLGRDLVLKGKLHLSPDWCSNQSSILSFFSKVILSYLFQPIVFFESIFHNAVTNF
jgi:hypothetical protein